MLQFIVLLAIMAIWALTSLLSREAQPLPPRPARGPGPDGPRPAPPASRGDAIGAVARHVGQPTGCRRRRSSAGLPVGGAKPRRRLGPRPAGDSAAMTGS